MKGSVSYSFGEVSVAHFEASPFARHRCSRIPLLVHVIQAEVKRHLSSEEE